MPDPYDPINERGTVAWLRHLLSKVDPTLHVYIERGHTLYRIVDVEYLPEALGEYGAVEGDSSVRLEVEPV